MKLLVKYGAGYITDGDNNHRPSRVTRKQADRLAGIIARMKNKENLGIIWRPEVALIAPPVIDDEAEPYYRIWEFKDQVGGAFTVLSAPTDLTVIGLANPQQPLVRFSWLPVEGANSYRVEQSIGAAIWGDPISSITNTVEMTISPGEVSLRVAAVDNQGRVGPWARWTGDTNSMFFPPPGIYLSWLMTALPSYGRQNCRQTPEPLSIPRR
jgi:hypothetical protein